MEKKIIERFGKKYYLLGTRKEDGVEVWLEEATFDCGWYWGIGYVEAFNDRYTDVDEHTHFDYLFLEHDIFNGFKEYFVKTVLTDSEIWSLLETMQTLYTCRHYADMLHTGCGISGNKAIYDIYKNDDEYNRINKEVIPKLLEKVYELLSE